MALLYPVSGLVLARAGRAREARADLAHAGDLVDRMADVAPWLAVDARITLARAGRAAGRPGRRAQAGHGGRPAAAAATTRCRRCARGWRPPARPPRWTPRPRRRGVCSLTAAEMRVLRFLPTHLSFREIAAQLYVSRFTVKSQALAVYRKLGATSRAEAVERARGLGLLGQ